MIKNLKQAKALCSAFQAIGVVAIVQKVVHHHENKEKLPVDLMAPLLADFKKAKDMMEKEANLILSFMAFWENRNEGEDTKASGHTMESLLKELGMEDET